jgi:hypothetical protein
MTDTGLGIGISLPSVWEGQIRPAAPAPAAAPAPGARTASLGAERAVLHAANFALPADRGDYGSGAVERMGPPNVLVCLLEHDPSEIDLPLFRNVGVPKLTSQLFAPSQMQRTIVGMAGAQQFFQAEGRTFCLYVVVGSHRTRGPLVQQADAVVQTLAIAPR